MFFNINLLFVTSNQIFASRKLNLSLTNSIYLVFFFSRNTKKTHTPIGIYMFKVNNRNTRTRCEIWSQLTIKTPEQCQCRRSGAFNVNLEHISHHVLAFLLLTLSKHRTRSFTLSEKKQLTNLQKKQLQNFFL